MSKQHETATAIVRAIRDSESRCLTVATLVARIGAPRGKVEGAVKFLAARQLVEHSSRGCYRLTAAGRAAVEPGVFKSKTGTRESGGTAHQANGASGIRARVWNALRISGALAIEAILTRVDTGDTVNARATVTRYLRGLINAGIVTIARRNYVLLRNLGPFAPTVGRRHVFDPNAGKPVPYIEEASQ